jgi:hypothetical protein
VTVSGSTRVCRGTWSRASGSETSWAVPDLLVSRCVGSVFWRAGRWRRGQSALGDVADRVAVLEATETWLAVHRGELLSVLVAAEDAED